jgi:HEAT repeat protein
MVTRFNALDRCHLEHPRFKRIAPWVVRIGLMIHLIMVPTYSAEAGTPSTIESKATALFKTGDYPAVTALFQELPPDAKPTKEFLRLSLLSYVRLGRTDEALTIYTQVNQPGQPHDFSLLRPLALGVITSHVRDRKDHVRVAAYSALAELGLPETAALLEDGLLDPSVVVRARAAEAIGKAGLAAKSGALRRALRDGMPTVRIAAMTALGDANAFDVQQRFLDVSRTEDGPESIFASAALIKLGRSEKLSDITSAATLPDAESRMAALGVLGRLKRPASLAVLAQAVYDPDPSVRAFAAGALGEFGSPDGMAPLTHAIGDEMAMVRGVAAASLGKLGVKESRPLLMALTRDSDFHVRANVAEGLFRLGDPSAMSLATDLARHPDPSIRSAAAQALSASSDDQALTTLQSLLQDQQPLPRLMAAKALRKSRANAVPLLVKGLHDSDEVVRIAAANSLLQQLTRRSSSKQRS